MIVNNEGPEVEEVRVPAAVGGTQKRIRILSLTGGGYRGLFTATVLAHLEEEIHPRRLVDCFDVLAGTSIGGLVASGLSIGVPAKDLAQTIAKHGPQVFPRKVAAGARKAVGTLYDAKPLRKAIDACLGDWADKPIKLVPVGLVVTAINWVKGGPVVFRSGPLGAVGASKESLRDVCLATSAAPTFFPAHEVSGAPMIDGGLVANNPDGVAVLEALRRWPAGLDHIEMLSIGTAGVGTGGMTGAVPTSGMGWMSVIVPFMISAQERLAAEQAAMLLGTRYMRINHNPQQGQAALAEMSVVDSSMTSTLQALAKNAVEEALNHDRVRLQQLLS